MKQVVVIGGGASGMMAAIAAAQQGAQVRLIEKNEKLGKKLYITGKGRCNLTNDCTREEFFRNVPRNPRFLMSCLSALDPQNLMALFEEWGVPLKVERGDRVFPASDHASDITRAMALKMEALRVDVKLNTTCEEILTQEGSVACVRTNKGDFVCDAVVLATGGITYPATGSTGDGYRFAQALGHEVSALQPSLVPLETRETWPHGLSGLTLKNVALRAYVGKKKFFDEQGEMLMTHFGLSGPLVLSLSAHLPQELDQVQLFLDMKPALSLEQVDARLLREAQAAQRKELHTMLSALVPANMASVVCDTAAVAERTPLHQLSRIERGALAQALKGLPLHIQALRPPSEAVITRGGVSVNEIQPRTMESKRVPGLYITGELLDTDAYTGGFNLQIAFSTGYAAGKAAGEAKI